MDQPAEKRTDAVAGGKSVGAVNNDNDNVAPAQDEAVSQSTPPKLSRSQSIALVAAVSGAGFLNTFSSQAAVITLPTISRDLNIPPGRQQLVISVYGLAFGCFLLLWGRVADIFNKRTIFVVGSIWVTLSTAVTAFAPNEGAFHAFRALQGIGAAANVPTAIGVLGTTFARGKARIYAFSFYSAATPLGSVLGNLLSGFIASYTSWKWVFGVLAILAACVTIAGYFTIPPQKSSRNSTDAQLMDRLDLVGAVLSTTGLGSLLYVLSTGNQAGWATPWVPVVIVVAIALIIGFIVWERHLEASNNCSPLLRVSLFRTRDFSASMAVMCMLFASFNGFLVYTTIFYQDYQQLSALQTTLRFIPTGVVGVVMAISIAPLLSRISTVPVLLAGSLSTSISSLLFAVPIPTDTSYFKYGLWAMILATLGADSTTPCLYSIVSHAVSDEYQAVAGAMLNVSMQLGRVLGLAIATATQTAVTAKARHAHVGGDTSVLPWDESSLKGLRAANWLNFSFGIASLVIIIAVFSRSTKAARNNV
ncbi:drug resistance protein [Akanthomyces lecanii RCEF 1005]|uniref:Drug resistance protein n=1 Tax=Akanthomyces lecanii RCEF 1005 TaxID=1081108 RepID=A0A162LK77_CORDF|nr:drug resistance protein [Akanthomyces lecanii RCEF 1005]